MSDGTKIEHAPSTNGRVYPEPAAPVSEASRDAEAKPRSTVSRLLVPAVIVVTALIVLRRMQRGNYV
jgi:hypothetical protein